MRASECKFPRLAWFAAPLLSSLGLAAAVQAAASELAIRADYVRIEWHIAQTLPGDDAVEDARSACASLAGRLLAGDGPWGLGLFEAYGCYISGRLVAGKDDQSGGDWLLQVEDGDDKFKASLSRSQDRDASARRVNVGSMELPGAWDQRQLLKDATYAETAAALLLDSLPMSGKFRAGMAAARAFGELSPGPSGVPAPQELTLFRLSQRRNSGLWRAYVVGAAKLDNGSAPRWVFTGKQPASAPDTAESDLFAGRPEGPGHARTELFAALERRSAELHADPDDAVLSRLAAGTVSALRFATLDSIAAGYAGFRVGRTFAPPGGAYLPAATLYGLLVELRGGAAAGLRFYYDSVPARAAEVEGERLYFGFSRLVAGYAFGRQLPWHLGRAELTPKIGVWTVDARMPWQTQEGDLVIQDFHISRALSVGIEASTEWEASWYLLRPWYARDFSRGGWSSLGKNEVSSDRFGLDGVIKGPSLPFLGKDWHLAFLVFAVSESITIRGARPDADAAGSGESFELGRDSTYFGGGISLLW